MASFSISYTDTSVTVSVTGITSGQTIRFYVRRDPDPGSSVVDKKYTASATYMTRSFYNLSPDTDYACNVEVGTDWIGTEYFTTDSAEETVEKWSWDESNGSASDKQTQAAYSAVTSNGDVSDFSYLVWNDLVDKVREVQQSKGYSWLNNHLTYNQTRMSASDKVLTAARFNSCRFNIGSYYSTGISEVSSGDIVKGSYFTKLASCINKWIG